MRRLKTDARRPTPDSMNDVHVGTLLVAAEREWDSSFCRDGLFSLRVYHPLPVRLLDYWNHVLWSDEMKIDLFGSDGFKHVWRRPGEECKDKCVKPTVNHGGGNDIV